MNNVTKLEAPLTPLEAAKAELAKEQGEKAKTALKAVLRDIAAAETVLRSLKLKLADLQQQIADGTL
jgi:flagellar biosynthesis chaperone FliJ